MHTTLENSRKCICHAATAVAVTKTKISENQTHKTTKQFMAKITVKHIILVKIYESTTRR